MISKAELSKKSKSWGIRFDVVEKDFCIGWLLKGIAEKEEFEKRLIFKGGTALRKCYFEDYRFSEDLDFTVLSGLKSKNMEESFALVCERLTDESGCGFELTNFQEVRDIQGEEAYEAKIAFRGPTEPQNVKPVIKIDLSFYETVALPAVQRKIIHPYSDSFNSKVLVYSLEEILAEKLRAILQQKMRVPRPRDFYDAWMLLKKYANQIKLAQVRKAFIQKCKFKNVPYHSVEDFFDPALLRKNKAAWEASIAKQVSSLIGFDQVIQDLNTELKRLLDLN